MKKKNISVDFLQDLGGEEYLSIFNDFSDGVIVTNAKGLIAYYNRAMSEIDDLDPKNVMGRQVTDIYDLDDTTSIIMQCLSSRSPILDKPIYYRTCRGKFANTIHNVMPIFNKKKLVGAICFVRDYQSMVATVSAMPLPGKEEQLDMTSVTFERIVGENLAFKDAIHSARMASGTPSPVMIFGETGTGKELFARAIHNHSSRHTRKFTPVNCAAIPENLLEGILFGTSKGAFTGAVEKAGLFERTSKGTIFLDEVNSMPVGLQAKILRSIQEKRVRRVGALKEIDVDLKIISSINQDPHISISQGTLRSDLYYRLGVVFIHIVPLRDRMDDLEPLVAHFIEKHNTAMYKQVKRISSKVFKLFNNYHWPGNVRELEHVIEGAMNVVGTGEVIRNKHLQTHFSNWSAKTKNAALKRRHDDVISETSDSSLLSQTIEHEGNIIQNTLDKNNNNIAKTARELGISRQLLYYKIKKFNIRRY